MGLKTKLKSFFALEDEYEEYEETQVVSQEDDSYDKSFRRSQVKPQQKIVSLQSVQKNTNAKVVLCEPRIYAEAQEIADHIVNRRAVVVNLQRVERDQAKRIVDFLSGTVYAVGGDIQKLGEHTFLCTPDNVDVSGTISELFTEQESTDMRW